MLPRAEYLKYSQIPARQKMRDVGRRCQGSFCVWQPQSPQRGCASSLLSFYGFHRTSSHVCAALTPRLLERHMEHIHTDWQGGETRRSWGIPAERYLNKRDGFGSCRLWWRVCWSMKIARRYKHPWESGARKIRVVSLPTLITGSHMRIRTSRYRWTMQRLS